MKEIIRDIADFPKEGIIFKDISPLLGNPVAFQKSINTLKDRYADKKVDAVVGVEARGFIFASALAYALETGVVMIRKPGKLPYKTFQETYSLEYGTDTVEIHQDAFRSGQNILIIDDVLALTDLTHKADAAVDGLSRGMKQRLALARVLLHDPELLLLDEPASGLDPRARIEVRELLVALKEMGKTILISSHILHELSQLCTRIGIIEAGEMVAEGSLEDIFRKLQLMRVIHVRFDLPAEDLQQRIEQIPGVESVEQQVDRWAIRLHEDQMSVVDLHQALVDEKTRISMYQPEAMDMETAFMKLTEGKTA